MRSFRSSRARRATAAILLLACFLPDAAAPAGPDESRNPRPWIEKALAARKEKNYASFRENMQAAVRIAPGHPDFMFTLAVADALAGEPAEALAWLERVAEMGMIYPVSEEPAFGPLK